MRQTIDSGGDGGRGRLAAAVIVAARDEAERLGATLAALAEAFPGAPLWVADDGSRDRTAEIAAGCGADVATTGRALGKGGAVTLAARRALSALPGAERDVWVLCDGDLGASAARLAPLAEEVAAGRAELATAIFARRRGGGFGIALAFARWAIRRGCGLRVRAPLSGQRALTRGTLERVLPFAAGYGMEVAMTIDAVRAGARVAELELDLEHRASGRSPRGFAHRARQLGDAVRAYVRRGRRRG